MDTKQKKRTPSSRQGSGKGKGNAGHRSASAQTASRRRGTAARRPAPKKKPTPDVVYTPARPFSRNRFLLKLLTVAAVVVAIVFGISIFFKVETVVVSGTEKYTAWQVMEASGIREGDNLLTFGVPAASARIRAALPYVESVRIGIKLPDQVNIDIVEQDVVYAVKADDGTSWLITSGGRIVEQTSQSSAMNYTNILGFVLASPKQGAQAQAVIPQENGDDTLPEGETQSAVTAADAAQRLDAALTICQYLESNGIIGQAASVDVTNTQDLQLWYGQQYQVLLGDSSELNRKIKTMKTAIDQMDDYQSGVLDVSFTLWPDQPAYKPF